MLNFNLEEFVSTLTGRSESLLGKDIQDHRRELIDSIEGQSALVIGGAGTIGSSFVKAIMEFKPARLYVVDSNENALTELVRDLRSTDGLAIPPCLQLYPMNLGDPVFAKLVAKEGPFNIVANFAAHKHVRSEKDQFSIEAMLQNNVVRAKRLLDQLALHPPQRFFCVSTDKATNPVNVMGASKSLMERVIMAYSNLFHVSTARFANVAFSNGSLLDGFLHRLARRQPLSAPKDVRRYFVSPVESGQICMLSCMLGRSAEIMFPKLDYSKDLLTFSEIAERLLRRVGLKAYECTSEAEAREMAKSLTEISTEYPVYFFSSDTSGEKPVEEFFSASEQVDLNRFAALGVISYRNPPTLADSNRIVDELESLFNENADKSQIVSLIKSFVPDFVHDEKGKNLDQKM